MKSIEQLEEKTSTTRNFIVKIKVILRINNDTVGPNFCITFHLERIGTGKHVYLQAA
jgi:hypothetical protein